MEVSDRIFDGKPLSDVKRTFVTNEASLLQSLACPLLPSLCPTFARVFPSSTPGTHIMLESLQDPRYLLRVHPSASHLQVIGPKRGVPR